MPLSRLENFLKNAEGNILYVNPSDFDATDSFENRGNSLTRPFRTIQRALIEAARFSYQNGRNNDKIDNTTILVYPGTHYIDNRPGYSIEESGGLAVFKRLVNGTWTSTTAISEFSENSNFDIFDENNDLYKFNSVEGGVILPRGTSIVGLDLRKTKIRPMYVPDPQNNNIPATAIFRVTGTCYFTSFTIFDADQQKPAYKDQSGSKVSPNFSHHKLTAFEYADGVNEVFLNNSGTNLTDLQMYYYKVTFAYGDTSGRGLANFPVSSGTDFEPSIDEYRIVGDLNANPLGITSIRSGDGSIPKRTIRIDTNRPHGLFKDTPVLISGITTSVSAYNGSFLVSDVIDDNTFTITSTETPVDALPTPDKFIDSKVIVESDSVSSASPYIFSCTLRSVYGMNGMHADGNKATGFKSMLVAQFTGISLQKDDNAFILFDEQTGIYNDTLTVSEDQKPLHINSRAIYKPEYENTHIKTSNDAIIQCVSIFAIGYAKHFVSDSGGDQSITNSNSNFGAVSLEASGFRRESFDRDDVGYITHVIPPREPEVRDASASWLSLDATRIVSVGKTERLYISEYNNSDVLPPSQVDSYRIGAKRGEELYLSVTVGTQQNIFKTPVLMPVPSGIGTSSEKVYTVGRSNVGINTISNNILTFNGNHQLFNGEKVRLYSDTGELPSNLELNKIYYAITTGLNPNQIKLASTLNDANNDNNITGISNGGGVIKVISSVSDKQSGDVGHPVQFDSTVNQWYVLGSNNSSENTIYSGIVGIGTSVIGETTGSTFITRRVDNRGLEDRIYKIRYVIPKEQVSARPPSEGFIIQESKSVGIGSVSYLTSNLSDPTQLKNPKIIVSATANTVNKTATFKTEYPHNFVVGDTVAISNVVSTANTTGDFNLPYNGTYEVVSTNTSREFTVYSEDFALNPGTFLNQTNLRSTQQQIESLPTVRREKYNNTLFIYRISEVKKHIPGVDGQDGVYNITAISGSISPDPNVGFGISERKYNQDIRDLYPQQDRDNFDADPSPAISYAMLNPLGRVLTNDKRNSITKESINYFLENNRIGFAVTGAVISGSGNTTITLYTNVDHNFNQIRGLQILSGGSGYNNSAGVTTTIYAAELNNSLISGRNATARVVVSAANTVSSVRIVDPGSAYGIGNTLTVSSSPAGAPITSAVVRVTEISNNIGDTLELSGFVDPKYNGVFRIVDVPSSRSISIYNPNSVGSAYSGRNDYHYPVISLVSSGTRVSSISYTKETGIATVTCSGAHGLLQGNSFSLVGAGSTFSKKYVVNNIVGINTFNFNAGISTVSPSFPSGITVHKYGYSSNAKPLGLGEENLGSRGSVFYAGISTTLSSQLTKTATTITLTSSNGINKGDYLAINSEIVRVISDPTSSTINVIRGQLSTFSNDAPVGTLVRKIRVIPVEIRRHSILRASGHTFEYLGYGPGNYSTGFPIKQDRVLSENEVLVSQAREQNGGTVVYTGMNDKGEFYSGATKINGATGEETVIEAPVVTYYGDDANQTTKNTGIFDDVVVKERIVVEGGENSNQTSQFYGPVNFLEKVSNTSDDGIDTKNLFVRGVASQSKLITVGIQTPTDVKKNGDVSFIANPDPGGYIGHVYADGDWRRWGMISREKDSDFLTLDRIGIGQSAGVYNFSDALEVNGTVKIKNLYVGGAVTFAQNQTFSGVTYDNIVITSDITLTSAGSTNYTIKHPNANSISQFRNLEVTGLAATFTSASVTFQSAINSTFTGVSTFAGTLNVNNLVSNSGVITSATFRGTEATVTNLSVTSNAYVTSGIVTNLKSTTGTIDNLFTDVGIITSITGVAATITTINATTGFIGGLRATSSFTTPSAFVNTGVTTTLSGTNLTYTRGNIGLVTSTESVVTNWIGAPTAYINTGICTNVISSYIGGSGSPLLIAANIGIVTSITGVGATYTNIRANSDLSSTNLYANVGVVTTLRGTQANFTGIITCQSINLSVPTGSSPLQVSSTTKVTNLNADLLDGFDTSSSNTASTVVVRDGSGNFAANIITANELRSPLQYSIGVSGALTITNGTAFNNSESKTINLNASSTNTANFVVQRDASGNFSAGTITASLNGNANTATTATNVSGGSVSATSGSFTSLSVISGGNANISGSLTVTGDITGLASDERLKTDILPITNALSKVSSLRGFTYKFNDIAKSLGLSKSDERFSGVSAQEVQKVLPEAVKPAPVDNNYLTVQYEKLIPLLIESIKELKSEVDSLRGEIDKIKSDK